MTITLVSVKGAPLSIPEFDGNFEDLDGRLQYFETGTGQPQPGIVNITTSGLTFTFHFSDGSTMSASVPPPTMQFRGEWQADTLYNPMDIIVGPQGTAYSRNRYLVLYQHTSIGDSAGDFDPSESTAGQDYYALLMPSELARTQEITTATFDPSMIDAQSFSRCTNAAGCVVTIPDDGTVAFPIDTELHFRQCATGQVSFIGENSGIDINYAIDENPQTAIRGAVCTVKKIGVNQWDLFGRLEVATA